MSGRNLDAPIGQSPVWRPRDRTQALDLNQGLWARHKPLFRILDLEVEPVVPGDFSLNPLRHEQGPE